MNILRRAGIFGFTLDGLTTDPKDPELGHGADTRPVPQNKKYLVLSEDERAKGFVRPLRLTYWHKICGNTTTMGQAIAETYARDPHFYGATYCVHCRMHLPVGENSEFWWCNPTTGLKTEDKVGT